MVVCVPKQGLNILFFWQVYCITCWRFLSCPFSSALQTMNGSGCLPAKARTNPSANQPAIQSLERSWQGPTLAMRSRSHKMNHFELLLLLGELEKLLSQVSGLSPWRVHHNWSARSLPSLEVAACRADCFPLLAGNLWPFGKRIMAYLRHVLTFSESGEAQNVS